MAKKKIKFVLPLTTRYTASKNQVRWRFPPYALSLLAGLTPPDFDIEIANENVDVVNYDDSPDLVGISCVTATATRGYQLADQYRARGIPVVLGGKHPTACPEEASSHADAVVVGEAELTWPALLEDFKAGKMKNIYHRETFHDLTNLPLPRRDLLEKSRKKYDSFNTIQTTRGCPYDCEFCSTGIVSGRKVRTRPIGEVIKEIQTMRINRLHPLIFWDDTINCVPNYAKELFKALIPLKLTWFGYASANMAEDEELVSLARQSGCVLFFVGFESVSHGVIDTMQKSKVLKHDYKEVIKIFHKHNIGVLGSFIFGLDGDYPNVFENTWQFIQDSEIDAMYFNIVQPYPGTKLYDRLKQEGRIIATDWGSYFLDTACFVPKNMTVAELENGYRWIYQQAAGFLPTTKRVYNLWKHRRESFLVGLAQNLGLRRTCKLIHQ
jgi:radical SAM superfamily enzyme YgiQ (UPF0313 family)